MTFSMKNQKLLDSDPNGYTFTEKQHEVDDSPPGNKEYEFKNEDEVPESKKITAINEEMEDEESEY